MCCVDDTPLNESHSSLLFKYNFGEYRTVSSSLKILRLIFHHTIQVILWLLLI